MGKQLLSIIAACFVLIACEKVKEQPNLKKYPLGVKFSTSVYPILSGSCGSCHSTPGDKDFSTVSAAYSAMQSNNLNVLSSQPASGMTDSVKYWTEIEQLVNNCAFHNLITTSHKSNVSYSAAQTDTIYGWIIEGGKNN